MIKKVGIILSLCVLQAFAHPTVIKSQNIHPQNESNTVAAFRAAINEHFGRFNDFYLTISEQMNSYRLIHVNNINQNYQVILRDFGSIISALRLRGGNQYPANSGINACATRANASLTDALSTYFYPTFRLVQERTSNIPLITLDALRRGNVFNDNSDEMLNYLQLQFESYDLQWRQTVSKFFRWEKSKVDITANFYQEEMNMCLCQAVPEGITCPQNPIPTDVKLDMFLL